MMISILFIAVLLLTYSNGANDNFKGVATLWSSKILTYKQAITLTTVATFFGSIIAYFFAATLLKNFSGKGLVPNEVVKSIPFILSVALGAGITVLLATAIGFPISTTHALVGGLLGAGIVMVGKQINISMLGKTFFLPLILSPLMATLCSAILYFIFKKVRLANSATVNGLHIFSAATVCFSRGLNDTPKIVSLLLIANYFELPINFFIVGIAMATGGILNAKKVAETISHKIAVLTPVQGLGANSITGLLVIAASYFGLPVSTTHVSVGSIYGVGLVDKNANNKELVKIVLSWMLTLPVAIVSSMGVCYVIANLG